MFCWWFREESACNAGDLGPTLVSGRSPGGGHGNPLQSSCQENFTDRRAWRASWDGKEWDTTGVTNTFTVNFHANLLAPLKPHIVFPIIYCNLRNQYLSTKYLKVQNASLLRWRFNWRWKGSWGKVARVWGVRWGREASGWSPVQFHGCDFGSDPPGQLCGQVTSLKCLKLWLGARIHPSDSGTFHKFQLSSVRLRWALTTWGHSEDTGAGSFLMRLNMSVLYARTIPVRGDRLLKYLYIFIRRYVLKCTKKCIILCMIAKKVETPPPKSLNSITVRTRKLCL